MHLATLHLAPILGAEKSRVPFYIAGGVLVAWALIVSIGVGLRRPEFPGGEQGERAVIAVSAVLVLATLAAAVLTASTPAKTASAAASPAATTPPAATTTSGTHPNSTAAKPAPPASQTSPRATTGTPAPPSSPSPRAASSALALAANPAGQLSFNTRQLSTKAGAVAIAFTNSSPLEHNVTVAFGATVVGSTPTFVGGTKTLTLSLKPGIYTFYCSVPGHRAAGMEGTLAVS
jgi:plastocyanin